MNQPTPTIDQLRQQLQQATGDRNEQLEAAIGAQLGAQLLIDPRPTNVEEAVAVLTRSLELIPPSEPSWPGVASNLAAGYLRRQRQDPLDNWETARDLIERACQASSRETDPKGWATNQSNYAYLLTERPGGSHQEDLTLAIEHIHLALEERSPETNRVDWAYSQLHLGLIHERRNYPGDQEAAEQCYRNALTHLRPDDDPALWARLEYNVGNMVLTHSEPDLAEADSAANAVLSVTSETTDPQVVGLSWWLLARSSARRRGPQDPETIRLLRGAFEVLTPEVAPAEHLRVGSRLTDVYSELKEWQSAADAYASMLAAFELLYEVQPTAADRKSLLAERRQLPRWAAFALAAAGRTEEAVQAIEQGRARELTISAGRSAADVARLAQSDLQLAETYEFALAQYRAALRQVVPTGADLAQFLKESERTLRAVEDRIRQVAGFEDFLRPISLSGIAESGHDLPVVYLVSAPAGSCILTVRTTPGIGPHVAVEWVPEVTSRQIAHIVIFDADEPSRPTLLGSQMPGRPRMSLEGALARLQDISPLLNPVADMVAADPDHGAIVIPTGLTGLIPLHSVPVRGGNVLDDVGEFRIAPSAAAYAACYSRGLRTVKRHLVAAADTVPSAPLAGSRAEVAAIAALFAPIDRPSIAIGYDATRTWLLGNARSASHLHIACHGYAELSDPLAGRLMLSQDAEMSVEDLTDGRLEDCRLAVASACQSAIYSLSDMPDQVVGLPLGFLQAGAACAVATLWPVDDYATALLMNRFYEFLDPTLDTHEQGPVRALRNARRWLRGLSAPDADQYVSARPTLDSGLRQSGLRRPDGPGVPANSRVFASPVYWSAFVAVGC